MSYLIRLEAYDPAGSSYTLADEAAAPNQYGPTVTDAIDWGNATWENQVSGPRSTLGRVTASSTIADRQVTIPARFYGSSKDDLAQRLAAFNTVIEAVRKYGGRIVRRAHAQSYRQYLEVMNTTGLQVTGWTKRRTELNNRAEVVVTFTCAPYASGDSMDWVETFTTDRVNGADTYGASYTADAGVLATDVAVKGGTLTPIGALTTERRIIQTATGYRTCDQQVAVRFRPGSTLTSQVVGVVMRRKDANNYLAVTWNLGTNACTLRKVIAGVTTTQAITFSQSVTPSVGQTLELRATTNGNMVRVDVLTDASSSFGTHGYTNTTTPVTLSDADAAALGRNVAGQCGFIWTPQSADARITMFEALPFTWGGTGITGEEMLWPEVAQTSNTIPGDAPALGRITTSQPSTTIAHAAFGWMADVKPRNILTHGRWMLGATTYSVTATAGDWRTGAVTGVTGACTAMSWYPYGNGASAMWQSHRGANYAAITCPATANTGASYLLHHRFRSGKKYVALAWLAGSAATTARIRLGVSGDIASSTAAALPTAAAPSLHVAVWKPTQAATLKSGWFAAEVTAATATTVYLSNPCVFEARTGYLSAAITTTAQTTVTLADYPGDWGEPPFMVLADSEIMAVTARSGTTLTVDRGVEGTTAATHLVTADIYQLPPLDQLNGDGGHAPVGVANLAEIGTDPVGTFGLFALSKDGTGSPQIAYAIIDAGLCRSPGSHIPVEVWLHFVQPTWVNPRYITSIWELPLGQIIDYADTGMNGKPARVLAGTQHTRLGVVNIPVNTRVLLKIEAYADSGSGTHQFGNVVLLPATSRCVSTGVAAPYYYSYPLQDRVTAPDLSCRRVTLNNESSVGPMSGSLIEVPPGSPTIVASLRDGFPDAFSNASSLTNLHLEITPRFAVIRG